MRREAAADAIVVLYHNPAVMRLCEELLSERSIHTIVVVVNGASEALLDTLRQLSMANPSLHLLLLPRNVGFGQAVNIGAAVTESLGSAPFILTLSHEVRFSPGDASRLVDILSDSPPNVAAVGPRLQVDGIGFSVGGKIDWRTMAVTHHDRTGAPVDWIDGGCVVFRRAEFVAVRGYDPAYFLYYEDVDLGVRLCRAGKELRIAESVTVEQVTSGIPFDRFAVGLSTLACAHGASRRRTVLRLSLSALSATRHGRSEAAPAIRSTFRAIVALLMPRLLPLG